MVKHPPGLLMTLGNMRELGVHRLIACWVINHRASGVGYRDQPIPYADGVLFNVTKFSQALMAGAALPPINNALAFGVVQ